MGDGAVQSSASASPMAMERPRNSKDADLCSTLDIPVLHSQQIDALNSIRLGRGTYGHVEKARFRRSLQSEYTNVAIKFANDVQHRMTLIREAKIMHGLQHHPNCIRIYGIYDCPLNGMGVVMEYMDCKSLAELIYSKTITYKIDHALSWLYQLADAVDFFHSHDQIHRDLKLQNILLSDRFRKMKLCDFGTFTSLHDSMTCNRGTPVTMAPEIFKGERYNTKSDIYSIGIIMWQIIARREPYQRSMDANVLLWNVASTDKRPPELACSPVLSLFYRRCWHKSPEVRPTSQEVKEYFRILREEYPGGDEPLTDLNNEPVRTPQPNLYPGLRASNHTSSPMLTPNRAHRRSGSDQSTLVRLELPVPVVMPPMEDSGISMADAAMRNTRSQSVAENLSNMSAVAQAAAAFAARAGPSVSSPRGLAPTPPGSGGSTTPNRRAPPPIPPRPRNINAEVDVLHYIEDMFKPGEHIKEDKESVRIYNEHMAACHQLQVIRSQQREEYAKKHHYVARAAELNGIKKCTDYEESLRKELEEVERRISEFQKSGCFSGTNKS